MSVTQTDRGLTCRELVELVTDYLDGALSEVDRARFEEHLAVCEACVHYFGQIRRTVRLLGRLHESDLSPAARDELLAAFRTWKTTG